jgi:hypothetical protein
MSFFRCVACRNALRRILKLPYSSYSYLLPLLSHTLPVFDELCKRTARFITSCIFSPSRLVQTVSWHSRVFARYDSPLYSNALYCCHRHGWSIDLFPRKLVKTNC